jgi:hypothetical protein
VHFYGWSRFATKLDATRTATSQDLISQRLRRASHGMVTAPSAAALAGLLEYRHGI